MLTKTPTTPEDLYATLKHIKVGGDACHYSLKKCAELVPIINEINDLKSAQNAVILAHSYVTPDVLYGVADFVGDSYVLSKNAMATNAKKIIFAAVRFMGETAQILNPDKEVLIPGQDDGCSLADGISHEDVLKLRKEYPEHTFVCYINTTAEVKAECDVCVTSANVYKVVEGIPNEKIYFLPDRMMGQNLVAEMEKRGIKKDIAYYRGACHVHEEFSPEEILRVRTEYPEATIVSHPECQPQVCQASDFVGSTSQMLTYMSQSPSRQFFMLTECGLSSRLQVEFPDKEFIGTCRVCKYMKSNTLAEILRVFKNPTDRDRVIMDEDLRRRAQKCIDAMFYYTEK